MNSQAGATAHALPKPGFDSETHAVRDVLTRTVDLLGDQGAAFNPGLCIRERDGDISVHWDTDQGYPESWLISVPEHCLPDLASAEISVRDEAFAIDAYPDGMDNLRRDLLTLLVELYNASGKVPGWRATTPFLTLRDDPAVLDRLIDGRTGPGFRNHRTMLDAGDTDNLLTSTFLHARRFGLSASRVVSSKTVLLPIVDLLNHAPNGGQFFTVPSALDSTRWLSVPARTPCDESTECFVCYNQMDAHEALLGYGFVDTASTDINSVTTRIYPTDDVAFDVRGEGGRPFQGQLPKAAEEIRPYLPQVRNSGESYLDLQRLIIPSDPAHAKTLRRVLGILFQQLRPDVTIQDLNTAVERAERQLLDINLAYYDDLERIVRQARQDKTSKPAGRDATLSAIETMIEHQRGLLTRYAENVGVTARVA